METPKKVYNRRRIQASTSISVCRLCDNKNETRHLLRVFSKPGKVKQIYDKIWTTCGVDIKENDILTCICRKCESFVEKMANFRLKCQQVQQQQLSNEQELDMPVDVSVKRCIEISPSTKQPDAKQAKSNNKPSAVKRLFNSNSTITDSSTFPVDLETPVSLCHVTSEATCSNDSHNDNEVPAVNDPFPAIHYTPIISKPSNTGPEALNISKETESAHLSNSQQEKIQRAASTKQATAVAHIIKQHCPNVLDELKKSLVNDINSSCKNLCKRKNGTSLYHGNSYESMKEIDFKKICDELKRTNPFLIDIFNAVSGLKEDISRELQVKYSFIYSILMNIRWYELSVVQRVNTVLMIEGGCTKQVMHINIF